MEGKGEGKRRQERYGVRDVMEGGGKEGPLKTNDWERGREWLEEEVLWRREEKRREEREEKRGGEGGKVTLMMFMREGREEK